MAKLQRRRLTWPEGSGLKPWSIWARLTFFAVCLLLPISFSLADSRLVLTPEERAFLNRDTPFIFVSQTNYPPFEFVDSSGERQGIMVELARWLATEVGFHAVFTDTTFKQAQENILDGKADVLTSLFYSEARDQRFDFTSIVFDVPASIFVKVDRPDIVLLEHLNDKRIAMQRGDYAADFLQTKGISYTPILVDDFASAANAVISGNADLLIGDEQIVLFHLYRNNLHPFLKISGEPLYVGKNAMAVKEGEHLLQSVLHKGIAHARHTGTLDRLTNKWIGTALPSPTPKWKLLWPYALFSLALLLIAFIWNHYLRLAVLKRTAALTDSERRLRDILEGTQAGTWELDLISKKISINEFWAEMLGYTLDELAPFDETRRQSLIHPEDLPGANRQLRDHLFGLSEHYSCEIRMKHKNGHWVWILERAQVTSFSKNGDPQKVSGTHLDISISKQHEEELQVTASVFKAAREGITITSPDGTIIAVNDAFTRITGYSRAEAIGQNPRILKSHRQDGTFYADFWKKLLESGSWAGELWNQRKNGDVYPSMLTVTSVRNAQAKPTHFVGVFSDISHQKNYETRLEQMAYYDELTGLPNRSLLVDRLKQALTRARRHGGCVIVAYIDLDGFKEINDTHGHEAGDQVLTETAARLVSTMREEDTVARFGGDEFVIVLSERSDASQLPLIMSRLIARICEPILLEDESTVQVSASIGIVQQPPDGELEADLLIRQADQAMYQAKQAGRNRYHLFDAEHELAVAGQHKLIERIREGLQGNEFALHYQPKVNMRSGEIIGVEALARWHHPESGLLPPAAFLPVMQGHFVAVEFGRWVLNSAARQAAQWRRAGRHIGVSVNIDAIHLQQPDFVSELEKLLAQYPEIQDDGLEIEILETSALEDVDRAVAVIESCKRIGIAVALDDFGTGYSSLSYLRRLPFSTLKVDKSFVRDMLANPEDLAILESILGLSESFRLPVVAEGVETSEHGTTLLALGCDLAQGYAIARPMPAAELNDWLDCWQPDADWINQARLSRDQLGGLRALVDLRTCYASASLPERFDMSCSNCRFANWIQNLDQTGLSEHAQNAASDMIQQQHKYEACRAHLIDLIRQVSPEPEIEAARSDLDHAYRKQLEAVRNRVGLNG